MEANNMPPGVNLTNDNLAAADKDDKTDLKLIAWRYRAWRLLTVIASALIFTLAFPPVDYGIFLGFGYILYRYVKIKAFVKAV